MKKILNLAIFLIAIAVNTNGQGFQKTVATLKDIKLVQPDPNFPNVYVAGRSTAGDGGGGWFRWDVTSAQTTNYTYVASALTTTGQWVRTKLDVAPTAVKTLGASSNIVVEAKKVRVVGTGGATTLTSTPTISATGLVDGQVVIIQGTDNTNTVILQDEGGAAGTKLQLGASTRTLGQGDVIVLTYDSTDGYWYEVSFANN